MATFRPINKTQEEVSWKSTTHLEIGSKPRSRIPESLNAVKVRHNLYRQQRISWFITTAQSHLYGDAFPSAQNADKFCIFYKNNSGKIHTQTVVRFTSIKHIVTVTLKHGNLVIQKLWQRGRLGTLEKDKYINSFRSQAREKCSKSLSMRLRL